MASNNIILAVPSANSSVNYELPKSESAQLSFSPEDIDGIKLNPQGGLEISFVEGGQVTLTNFQSFIDNGNTLTLADGTNVDPKLLFTALGGHAAPTSDTLASDIIKIDVPAANEQKQVTLEPGQKYLMNFDLSETTGADVKNGNMEIGFANGGKITIANYETAMASATPAELSLAAKTCVVSGDELITNIQKLAATQATEEVVAVVEEVVEEEVKPKSKIAAADMEGNDNSGIVDPTGLGYRAGEVDVAKIEPAAGEADIARELAQIETAAGPAGGAGGRAGGYGFGSRPGSEPFQGKPDIGPINPTQLGYRAPELSPSVYIRPNTPGIPNSIPVIGPAANRVDETNLKDGNLTVSGDLPINYGNDRPGTIAPNDDFSSGGSRTNDTLTSGGQPIDVNVVGNTYVGTTPDGTVIFELVINPTTGGYTYTQFGPIDHADGNNPDDEITLEFGVIVTDHNGDSATTTITITVADDAPEIEGDEKTVDETDLGPITISDTLVHNFNQDGPGSINATGSFTSGGSLMNGGLSSSGQPISVGLVGNSYVGTTPDGTVIFELSINPTTGQYTYTQYGNLDHADGSDPDDIITLNFGVEIVDFDGDRATTNIVINIKDDAPIFQPPEPPCGCNPPEEPPPPFPGNPKPDSGLEIVDETALKTGPAVETGRLDADFGGDTPGSYAFQDGSFASSGSKTNGQLTHNGVPVVVTLVNGEWVGFAGDKQIFKLELDTATGDYRFTLYDNLDHANKTDPDDQIVLDFAVIASDFDGDSAAGSIRIIVKDDGPIANNDVNTYDTTFGVANGNVITGENGGPGAADNLSTDEFATGPANKVVKIAFEGNEVDVPETGTVSIDGQYGTLTIAADGTYTYEAFPGSGVVTPATPKEFVSGPALPDFDEGQALDGTERQSLGVSSENLSINGGETITVTYRSEGASYNNTLGAFTVGPDGTISAEGIVVRNGNTATVGQSFTYQAGPDASSFGLFLIANGSGLNGGYSGIDFSTGSLNFVYGYGTADARDANISDNGANIRLVYTSPEGVETVLNGPLYFTTDRGTSDNLNADGSVRVVSGVPGDDNTVLRIGFEDLPNLGDKDYNDMVFDVSITSPACGCKDPDIQDQFVYTIEDSDGDRDTATLTLNGQDLTDDQPIFVKPDVKVVDETDLAGGTITQGGTIEVNFGTDGPGTIEGNGSFTSGGSRLNDQLTSGGHTVNVTQSGNTYTGVANGVTIFTLTIATNGSYTFKLYEQLDHADGSNPNDIITLNFGVVATDCDGDKAQTTLTIKVADDAPLARNDSNSATEGQTVTGNVITNDVVGQDTPGSITKVTFGDREYDLTTGPKTIVGQYGTLVIDSTGAYSYTANSNNPNGTDNFTYTLRDRDGDTSMAKLSIDVTCIDDVPVISPSVKSVDETDLSSGTITQTGRVEVDYGSDAPGSVAGNGSFTSGGSRLNDQLTSGGQPVTVTQSGNTYTGVTPNGTTIFTLTITPDGSYTFKLYEQLDHADGSNPNDIITLNFGVTATDSDGDEASTTITIKVADDAPLAKNDSNSASEGQTVTGNVITNDVVGQDTPGSITKVTFGGREYDLTTGPKTIVGQYGTLTIDSTGAYSYKANSNNPNGTDRFTYTLKDNDGDTSTAKLSIDVTCIDDVPVIKPAYEKVDETDLKSGVITQTGSVTVDYGSDAPGKVEGNGSFTSGGSRLNNQLTSGGVPVEVKLEGNTYTGTANGTTIFTLTIATSGSYTFKLYEQLDHADGSNPNDIITLDFGVVATDSDGDTASTTITIKVADDAPDAKDDYQSMVNGTATINGNVTDNDTVGQDTPGSVISISFGGQTKPVSATGTTTINGQYGTLEIDSTGAYTYTAKPNAAGTDKFTYVLKDGDNDTDAAKLTIEVKENPIVVCIFADDICIKEDTKGDVPVHAYITGGNGNETMTITMTGVPAGWTVTAPGWVKNGSEYTLTLPQGVTDWKGSVNFKPPANSDADLTSLVFKNTVYDPDTKATTFATDNAKVIVDAVIDPFKFQASLQEHPSAPNSGKIFVLTKQGTVQHSKLSIFNLTRPDADGSESLKTIIFTLPKVIAATTYISVKNADGSFTQVGTKSTSGQDTVYKIDLSGMTYEQAVNYITKNLYLTNTGKSGLDDTYEVAIQIVSYEKNLSGVEKDYSDNETSYTVCVPVDFCISPLVIDLDRDGVELLSKENGVLFDMTNDGIKDKTGWVASDDAFLVLDKNGDGIINDRSELFGNDDVFANGFDNLASYDLNGDGVIDAKDAIFADLRVWQDVNGDGISQADELKTLADVKIAAINLGAAEVSYDIAGNPITHESQVVFEDGGSSAVVDAWFAYEGGAGVDKGLTIRGTDGSDVISGTSGSDDLYGGLGADTFLFQTISQGVDTLKDFNAAEGDKIDLSNILSNFDPLTDAINDFVFATETDDGKTILSVNTDGSGEAGAQQLAIIETGNINVSDLFNNGSIIV